MSRHPEFFSLLRDASQPRRGKEGVVIRAVGKPAFFEIHVDGYGEHEAVDGAGAPILLEFYDGRLRLIVATDINSGERQIIDLEGARETARKPETDPVQVLPTAVKAGELHEFEMTDDDLAIIRAAGKPQPLITLQYGAPPSVQQTANLAWRALGEKLGFDYTSVKPVPGKGQRFFTAVTAGETKTDAVD